MSCPRKETFGRAECVLCCAPYAVLDPRHRVPVIRIRLVPLEHRELGLVLVGDAFVAEVLTELVHALEPADDQALQVQLGRDPQVHVLLELVGVRDERLRERSAVARLQNRRLHLDEPLGVEVAANCGDEPCPREKAGSRVGVHQQVEVALPVPDLWIGDAVKRVWQRPIDRAEQLEPVDQQRRLAAPRPRRPAGHADQIAEIEVDIDHASAFDEQLDPSAAVDEVEEDELSEVATAHHAAGKAICPLAFGAGLQALRIRASRVDGHAVREALGQRAHRLRV